MFIKLLRKFEIIIGPLGIFIFCSVITFIWFRRGLMFGGGEEGMFLYNPIKYLTFISHIWQDANGGYPVVLMLPRIPYIYMVVALYKSGMGTVLIQSITFLLLFLTGCLSVYYLTKEIIDGDIQENLKRLIPFLASFFYFFNPYSMSQVWGRGIYGQFFGFALLPLFTLFFILGLKYKKIWFGILAIFASILFSASFVVATQAIILWVPSLIYLIFHIFKNTKNKTTVMFSMLYLIFVAVGWVFSNFWWIYPTLQTGSGAYSKFFTDTDNVGSFIASSKSYFKPTDVIRLLQGFLFFIGAYYGDIYKTFLFRLLSWLTPLVAAFSLVYIKKIKNMWFLITLFLLGFFISVGANFPLGFIFVWLFTKVPVLQAFRNSYEKAGLLLMLPYSLLFAIGLPAFCIKISSFFESRYKKNLSSIFGFITILIVGVVLVGTLWTGKYNNAWFGVPDYYREANNWLTSQGNNFRIMQMPFLFGDGLRYDWENPYQGIEPSEFLFTPTSVGKNIIFNKIYYNIFAQRLGVFSPGAFGPDPDISKSEFRSQEFWQELAKLNVRYIVFHNDINEKIAGVDIKSSVEYLKNQKNIKFIKTFGKLDIYQVFIPENISRIYSPDIKTEVTKISSSNYVVKIKGEQKPIKLYFLDLYDSGWNAFIDGQLVDTHTTVFSYANSWTIDKKGDYEIEIKYLPQDSVVSGWKITEITLLIISLFGIVLFIQDKIINLWKK